MSSTTTTSTTTETPKVLRLRPKVDDAMPLPPFEYAHIFDEANYGDWRDELATKGWTVVKGAVPRERALSYRERMFEWLESFPLGFKRDDPSTWTNEHLPVHAKGGMFWSYGLSHESFCWDLRQEQGIIDAFTKVWGTDELVTSFDAGCIMLPGRTDVKDDQPWEHMDQSRHRRGFYCVQGIANLNENGPDDGGLMVMTGSSQLVEEYFDTFGRTYEKERTFGAFDYWMFSDEELKWFENKGCKWVKVTAGPGDLILWDSRALHYNVRPKGEKDRCCTYICMAPAKLQTEEDKRIRKEAFEAERGTTHVPIGHVYSRAFTPSVRDGKPDPLDTGRPRDRIPQTDKILKLAGIKAY
ncbi:hypothetical protein I316_05885 [Kwoniella heveanensis BCC8398]|uniref:Phytanoyl-CoA dioxygenase n=1 Tax=Kwoniella heveanensis BCC8398 TaxID=1296120 RepID=A0A1B9GN08_9TREE|nr:hypothetical protein I316_05885 [Kwoniella heveanensis BCC8398]